MSSTARQKACSANMAARFGAGRICIASRNELVVRWAGRLVTTASGRTMGFSIRDMRELRAIHPY
jgi:hypothetical protein